MKTMKNRFAAGRLSEYARGKFGWRPHAIFAWRGAGALASFLLFFYSAGVQAQPFAYVVNAVSNNVSVINTANNTVAATVTVGNVPVAVGISPNGSFAYVTNFASHNVSIIDIAGNTVVASVPVGRGPSSVAFTPDGAFAYVGNFASANVSVINTAGNSVVATVTVGSFPYGVALTPNGSFVYVANANSDNVSVINTSTNTVVATIAVGDGPEGVSITPDGSFAYVANRFSDNVSVIEVASNTVIATVPVEDSPREVAFTPNSSFAYVTNRSSASVSVIEIATHTVIGAVPVGTEPQGIALTPNGSFAYVTNVGSDNVSVIDISANSVIATVPAGSQPFDVAITPAPEIDVRYNGVSIVAGDNTPDIVDGTDFGAAEVSGGFVSRIFTIANTGSANLNLTGALPRVQVSGANPGEFTILSPAATPVSPGGTTTFWVHFHPDAPGLRTATFSIANDDGDENPFEFSVQGIGVASVSPYVFLANKITLEETEHNTPGGEMHSNGTLYIEKGEPTVYNSNLTAVGKITIEKNNTLNGNVRSQTSISNSGKINGTRTIGPVNVEPLPSLSYSAGGANKSMPNGGTLILAPGSYGIVTMSNNGTLKLTSGEYFFNELRYSSSIEGGVIEIDLSSGEPAVINVVSSLQFGHEAAIRLLPNGESDSELVTFNTLQSAAANWGHEAYLLGAFNAPNAKVTLVKNTQLRGAISAKEIFVSSGSLFLHHDAPGSLPGPGNLSKPSLADEEVSREPLSVISAYELAQNYPNPFNPTTTIGFALPQAGEVNLSIYNMSGQLVKQLIAGARNAGFHHLVWDATNERGERVASGVYLYVIKAGEFTAQRKLVLMK